MGTGRMGNQLMGMGRMGSQCMGMGRMGSQHIGMGRIWSQYMGMGRMGSYPSDEEVLLHSLPLREGNEFTDRQKLPSAQHSARYLTKFGCFHDILTGEIYLT